MRRISLCLIVIAIPLIVATHVEARGFCQCVSNYNGQVVIEKCVSDFNECRSKICPPFKVGAYEPNPSEFVCPTSQPQPQPQPQPDPPGLIEVWGPKTLVAPCTSETCNQCCYHNNGEAAAIIPANARIFKTRGYISPLMDPNGQMSPCDSDDCDYGGFFMAPIIRSAPAPLGWAGPSLKVGETFIVQPFKNWSHNRQRSIQLQVRYTLPTQAEIQATQEAIDAVNAAVERVFRSHFVQKGQTLRSIALLYYGNALAWPRIAEANKDVVKDPARLSIGQIIRIPF